MCVSVYQGYFGKIRKYQLRTVIKYTTLIYGSIRAPATFGPTRRNHALGKAGRRDGTMVRFLILCFLIGLYF